MKDKDSTVYTSVVIAGSLMIFTLHVWLVFTFDLGTSFWDMPLVAVAYICWGLYGANWFTNIIIKRNEEKKLKK